MKLIHTADWHLGAKLHGHSRISEQRSFLNWLTRIIQERNIDALLISGDIFDHYNPSTEALTIYYDFLAQAKTAQPHLQILIIAGNHDSPARLQAPTPLLKSWNIHVVGSLPWQSRSEINLDACIFPLKESSGKISGFVGMVPFLHPSDLHQSSFTDLLDHQTIHDLYQHVSEALIEKAEPHHMKVLMGHLHCYGGQASESSERPLFYGHEKALTHDIFDARIDYVALGHLHLAQSIQEHIRYPGSPLPLAINEREYRHQVLELTWEKSACHIQSIRVPLFKKMIVLQSEEVETLESLLSKIKALDFPDEPCFLSVQIRGLEPLPHLKQEIIRALPEGKAVDLLSVRMERSASADSEVAQPLKQLSIQDVFAACYRQHHQEDPPTPYIGVGGSS